MRMGNTAVQTKDPVVKGVSAASLSAADQLYKMTSGAFDFTKDPTAEDLARMQTPQWDSLSADQKAGYTKRYTDKAGMYYGEGLAEWNRRKGQQAGIDTAKESIDLQKDALDRAEIERKNNEGIIAGEVERRKNREVKSRRTFLGYTPVAPYAGPKKTLLGM
jgi:hypothetical protein